MSTTTTVVNVGTRRYFVRNGGDYAEFFVDEREPVVDGEHTRYSATWVCYSSFGVYGHHWCSMGEPFASFIQGVGADYLLGKIARQVFDDDKFAKWMRREIFTARASREDKSEAAAAFRRLKLDYSGEALATMCYESDAISRCQPEWCDADSRSHDPQAVGFVKALWPKLVELLSPSPAAAGEGGK